jgi:hypothetical protein
MIGCKKGGESSSTPADVPSTPTTTDKITFNGDANVEVGGTLLIRPTIKTSAKNKTFNFSLKDEANDGRYIVLPENKEGVTSITIQGRRQGTATIHVEAVENPAVTLDIPVTVIKAKPTLETLFTNVQTLENYTIEAKLVSEDDISDASFDYKSAKPLTFTSGSGKEISYEAKTFRTKNAIRSETFGEEGIFADGTAAYGVDSVGNAGKLVYDTDAEGKKTGELKAGTRVRGTSGFLSADDFDGAKANEAPFSDRYFSSFNGVNPSWFSSTDYDKSDDNTYTIAYDGKEGEENDAYSIIALWQAVDSTGLANYINIGGSNKFVDLAKGINIEVDVFGDQDFVLRLSASDSAKKTFVLGKEKVPYNVIAYMTDVGTTKNTEAIDNILNAKDFKFELPALSAELSLARKTMIDNKDSFVMEQEFDLYKVTTSASGEKSYASKPIRYKSYINKDYMLLNVFDAEFLKEAQSAIDSGYDTLEDDSKATVEDLKKEYATLVYPKTSGTTTKIYTADVDVSGDTYSVVEGSNKEHTVSGVTLTWNDGGNYDFYQGNNFMYGPFVDPDGEGLAWNYLSDDTRNLWNGDSAEYHYSMAQYPCEALFASFGFYQDVQSVIEKKGTPSDWVSGISVTTAVNDDKSVSVSEVKTNWGLLWGNRGLAFSNYFNHFGTGKDSKVDTIVDNLKKAA